MKAIITNFLIFSFFPCFISQEIAQAEPLHPNVADDLLALERQCNYKLHRDARIEIQNSKREHREKFIEIFEFDAKINLTKRPLHEKLSFGCLTSRTQEDEKPKKSEAKDEIISADLGGRYGRIIEWQKRITARNWSGTVAYVNSVFGDGENMREADYFLACPSEGDSACFSIQFDYDGPLSKPEAHALPQLIERLVEIR